MQEDITRYVVRFKNGNFYTQSEGVSVFESYNEAEKFFKKNKIIEDFELIDEKEILYQTLEENGQHSLCLIWSKTNKVIWKQTK